MNYEFITDETKNYFHVILKGKDSVNVSLDYWGRIFNLIREKGLKKILIEEELDGALTALDAYKVSTKLVELAQDVHSKIAFFDRMPDHSSNNNFGETVAITRGVKIKVFSSLINAEKWLLKE